MKQEFRVSYKRGSGAFAHLRHRTFAKRETAERWMKWLSGAGRSSSSYEGDDLFYERITFGPRLQVRDVGPWCEA